MGSSMPTPRANRDELVCNPRGPSRPRIYSVALKPPREPIPRGRCIRLAGCSCTALDAVVVRVISPRRRRDSQSHSSRVIAAPRGGPGALSARLRRFGLCSDRPAPGLFSPVISGRARPLRPSSPPSHRAAVAFAVSGLSAEVFPRRGLHPSIGGSACRSRPAFPTPPHLSALAVAGATGPPLPRSTVGRGRPTPVSPGPHEV